MAEASPFPVIDISPFLGGGDQARRDQAAAAIAAACRATGFLYITGHGIPDGTLEALEAASRRFFALPAGTKAEIAMAKGGAAWRGWFPLGGELTSGRPDLKEGLYFGTELPPTHPRVAAGLPLHGANLWPRQVPELRAAVEAYVTAATRAAHALARGVAASLGLEEAYFDRHYTAEPTVLFRIFRYPPARSAAEAEAWGVGEHSDYGLLTLLAQDENGGLQVKTPEGWVDAPPLPGTLVCNIGDMLDRLTGGFYRSTPHRVRNASGCERYSFPLFFDPDFLAEIRPLPQHAVTDAALVDRDRQRRWDQASVHAFSGTYGDYLLSKVAKVFPQLGQKVL